LAKVGDQEFVPANRVKAKQSLHAGQKIQSDVAKSGGG
jgi:hypothetical protein